MRRVLYILPMIIALAITGCPRPENSQSGMDREPVIRLDLNIETTPMDVPYEAVAVTETARYTPPDGFVWPAAMEFLGRTVWQWSDDRIYVSAGTTVGQDSQDPAKLLIWNLTDITLEGLNLDPQPPVDALPPVTNLSSGYNRFFDGIIGLAYIGTGRESTTRAVSIDDGQEVSLPIIDKIRIYKVCPVSDRNVSSYEIDIPADLELNPAVIFADMDGFNNWELVFRELNDHEIPMPDGSIKLVPGLSAISVYHTNNPTLQSLSFALDSVYGADFTGFMHGNYFFTGTSPLDDLEYTYIFFPDGYLIEFPSIPLADGTSKPIIFNGYIPSFTIEEKPFFFGQVGDSSGGLRRIIALILKDIGPDVTVVTKLWDAEVPDIFDIATTIRAGSDDRTVRDKTRPYIVCLDPVERILTVFDPLLGSVRCSTPVDISEWSEGNPLPSFCVNYDPDPLRPIVLVHDPGTNEIIRFDIQVREPSEGGTIEPLDN